MSIKAFVTELETLKAEMKYLNEKRKKLKEREKQIEINIKEYLKSKEQPGLKHQGTAIILEEKEVNAPKKQKERNMDAMSILEKYGIKDSEKVLNEIMTARKGDTILKESIKIKKYKQNV